MLHILWKRNFTWFACRNHYDSFESRSINQCKSFANESQYSWHEPFDKSQGLHWCTGHPFDLWQLNDWILGFQQYLPNKFSWNNLRQLRCIHMVDNISYSQQKSMEGTKYLDTIEHTSFLAIKCTRRRFCDNVGPSFSMVYWRAR